MKSPETAYLPQEITEHLIRSNVISGAFRIRVYQPIRRREGTERFPVIYATDADYFFGAFADIANQLQLMGESPRAIVVGIGYENPRAAYLLRMRDFFTHEIRKRFQDVIETLAASQLARGTCDVRTVTQTTDATDFLRFIREDLMQFIEARYPAAAGERVYSGYSAGGSFGLYALFAQPETFKRYILGSPATSFGLHHFGIDLAQEFIASRRTMNAKVFISVGELEEFGNPYELNTGYYRLAKFLKEAAIPGLDLSLRLFPGETHPTAWTLAFTHGIKTLFGEVSGVPPWLEGLPLGNN